MDFVLRLAVTAVLLLLLGFANVWLLRLAVSIWRGGDLVVAPFQIVGSAEQATHATKLPSLLLARLAQIESELDRAQAALIAAGSEAATIAQPTDGTATTSILPPALFATTGAGLETRLLDPIDVDIKVAGIEVSRFIPAIQKWFVRDRTLSFQIVFHAQDAVIAGDLRGLGEEAGSLWFSVPTTDPDLLIDRLAFALLQRKIVANRARSAPEVGALSDADFADLVHIVLEAAELNRRTQTFRVPQPEPFAKLLQRMDPLIQRMPQWPALVHLGATIAESAGQGDRALGLYQALRRSDKAIAEAPWLKRKVDEFAAASTKIPEDPAQVITEDIRFAQGVLGGLTGLDLPLLEFEILADRSYKNAYWDGKKIFLPVEAVRIKDLTYHEAVWPYLQKLWAYANEGQAGALANSVNDALTMLIGQTRAGESAAAAAWELAPGAVAWIKGEDVFSSADQRPLRSLKAPGTAYDDPLIGKDPQPAHMDGFVRTTSDNGGVHVNSGIPNNAFYRLALEIGTEAAARIWVEALKTLPPKATFAAAAERTLAAAQALHGPDSPEALAVEAAWQAVGILPRQGGRSAGSQGRRRRPAGAAARGRGPDAATAPGSG